MAALVSTVLLVSMCLLLALGVSIAGSMGMASVFALLSTNLPLSVVAQKMVHSVDSFPLLAIPFFLLAGYLMTESGMARSLVDFVSDLVGWIRGGLVMVNIVTNVFMAGISGSSVADAAAIGSVLVRMMEEKGYNKIYCAASIASASIIAVIIPPSIPIILYGVIAGESIARLFLAGVVPGLLMGLALIALTYYDAVRHPEWFPRQPFPGFRELGRKFGKAIWALGMPVVVLGGILGGVVTPTEASVIAAVYALVFGIFVYKQLTLRKIVSCLWQAVINTAATLFLVGTAGLFGWLLAFIQLPQQLVHWLEGLVNYPVLLMLAANVILLLLGTFMDLTAQLIILTPVMVPLMQAAGFSPIHFGIVLVVNLAIGLITPPTAVCLNVLSNIANISLDAISKAVLRPMVIMCVVLILISYFPSFVTWLPNVIMPLE